MSMGALGECHHYDVELENTMRMGCISLDLDLDLEQEPETRQIEDAVRVLLHGLGEDVNREGIKKTPLRVAKALHHGTRGYRENVNDIVHGALFPEAGLDNNRVGHAGGAGGLVIVRDLDLFSHCESCLLPFQVKCHVGYVPSGQRVVGLSKLSRVSDVFAKRLQDPQRLADEVCSALQHSIKPAGVAVVLQCHHIHFPTLESLFLDARPEGSIKVLISSGSGVFEDYNADIWNEFLSLLRFRRPISDKIRERTPVNGWCPSLSFPNGKISSSVGHINPNMVSAVTSILRSLGEDPSRKELVGTPTRFVRWLLNFQICNIEMKLNGYLSSGSEILKSNGELNSKKIYSELNIPFWSQCEHHLLPFHGVVHIGYFSSEEENQIWKSLFQSIVHFYGFKLQVQERLTRQIVETVAPLVGGDVIVVAEASHTCMISRGIEKFGSSTSTVAVLGRFATDAGARALFLDGLPSSNEFHR